MKTKILFSTLALTACLCSKAQHIGIDGGIKPPKEVTSGDKELDVTLNDINVKANEDKITFKKGLSTEFGISEGKIDKIMIGSNMTPADTYMTLQIAEMTKKDPEVVANSFVKNRDKGWGEVAKEMGIKPGSPEFHALKGKAKNKKEKTKGKGKPQGGNAGETSSPGKGHGKGKGKK